MSMMAFIGIHSYEAVFRATNVEQLLINLLIIKFPVSQAV